MEMTMSYDLDCRYDTRKSFYGKAKVEEEEYDNFTAYVLYSYDIEVASIEKYNTGLIKYYYNGKYSQTTARHQKEFFKQYGLSDNEIKQLFKVGELTKGC